MQYGLRTAKKLRIKTSLLLVVVFAVATLWTYPRLVTNDWCHVHDHNAHRAETDDYGYEHGGANDHNEFEMTIEEQHSDHDNSDCLQIVSYWHSFGSKDTEVKIEAPQFVQKKFETIKYRTQEPGNQIHPMIFRFVTEQTLHFIGTIVLIV